MTDNIVLQPDTDTNLNASAVSSATTITNNNVNARQQQLENWLQQVFEDQTFILDSLPGDASARQYHRIQLFDANSSSDTPVARYIVMDSADEQDAMQQFVNVTKLMSPAVNVPDLVAQDMAQGFLVLQDFGATEFAHLLADAPTKKVNECYQLAMKTLIDLQKTPVQIARVEHELPDYDSAMLNREMDLFRDWFIPYIGVSLDETLWENLKTALMNDILTQPQVLVHRDYHSRNLMQDQADYSRLGVIDFQDAVIGAYTYDLVSLVRDAYVEWPESQVSSWVNDFWQLQQQAMLPTADSAEQFVNDLNVMGVQRHLKVLGIFIRLSERDGKNRYLADIPKVMRDLTFELNWLAEQGHDAMKQAVLPFNQWLQDSVLPAYEDKFAS
ncbi:aminoglycoside phosphotransferase family protein [Psychrobacter sp. Cmf 22.2]|uniref:aminoglycoside phosphotransferase family protein n=1 Tax=Psychrobacter sp. Cmf 22.2 TaxID=1926478 RepID=UPI001179FB19|nr:phosphotransferase [Psychrobacter sp. Cmf 22.2]